MRLTLDAPVRFFAVTESMPDGVAPAMLCDNFGEALKLAAEHARINWPNKKSIQIEPVYVTMSRRSPQE